ncbi:hypothetical protein JCM8097_002836 [Rhodosporidiobolus ruineniae]
MSSFASSSTQLKGICPATAPRTIGPYVHAMVHENTVYSTCIIPLDAATMTIVDGPAENQLRQIYRNLKIVLEEAGSSLDRIIKQNVFLTNFDDFEAFNKITEEFLGPHRPARSTMKVMELPKHAPMGMDVIAALK